MDEQEIKLECLRIASSQSNSPFEITTLASRYSDCVLGTGERALRRKAKELGDLTMAANIAGGMELAKGLEDANLMAKPNWSGELASRVYRAIVTCQE